MPPAEIYTLSLHDALPILPAALGTQVVGSILRPASFCGCIGFKPSVGGLNRGGSFDYFSQSCTGVLAASLEDAWLVAINIAARDRKSTRLNSSHVEISYAARRDLHSFPTRRSSDLARGPRHTGRGVDPAARQLLRLHRLQAECRRAQSRRQLRLLQPELHRRARRLARRRLARRDQHRGPRSEEHTSELQSRRDLVCRPPRSTLFPYTTLFRSCPRPSAHRSWGRSCGPPAFAAASASSRVSAGSIAAAASTTSARAAPACSPPRSKTPGSSRSTSRPEIGRAHV